MGGSPRDWYNFVYGEHLHSRRAGLALALALAFPIADDWLCSNEAYSLSVVLAPVDPESESGMTLALSYYVGIILIDNTTTNTL